VPATTVDRLEGGNISGEIVRVGSTVRRPTGPWTPSVHALLRHLEQRQFTGAPKVFGIDGEGREVLEYLPGDVPWPAAHHRLLGSVESVARMGRLLRAFHTAVADFDPGDDAVWQFPEMAADAMVYADQRGLIVCHNDPTAWNLVIATDRWAFIDWDAAGPRPAIWDVAYCAIGVIPISPDTAAAGWPGPVPVVDRLAALAAGYQLESHDRRRLPDVVVARIRSSYEHLQRRAAARIAPWDTLWRSGHGDSWARMLDFAESNAPSWVAGLAR
jgi:Ser/Thr protein kinase RdoA (MazF antagonist)